MYNKVLSLAMVDGVSVAVWRGCRPELGSAGWWIWIMEAGPVEATQELGAGAPELSPTPRPGETWPYTYTVSTLYITSIHTQLYFVS